MNNKRILFRVILTFIMLLLVNSPLNACNKNTTLTRNGDYLLLTETNELCSFSFEFSDYYESVGPHYQMDFSIPFMYITVVAPETTTDLITPNNKNEVGERTTEYIPAMIEVVVSDRSGTNNLSRNAREKLDSDLEDWSKWENYSLIRREPFHILGVEGEIAEYVVDWFAPFPASEGKKLEHISAVYFDYDGLVWVIEAKSRGDYNHEKLESDMEHIIETFKILD